MKRRTPAPYTAIRLHFWTTDRKLRMMDFEILGDVTDIETIAVGGIGHREFKRKRYLD